MRWLVVIVMLGLMLRVYAVRAAMRAQTVVGRAGILGG